MSASVNIVHHKYTYIYIYIIAIFTPRVGRYHKSVVTGITTGITTRDLLNMSFMDRPNYGIFSAGKHTSSSHGNPMVVMIKCNLCLVGG